MLAVSWTAARLLVRTPTFATSGCLSVEAHLGSSPQPGSWGLGQASLGSQRSEVCDVLWLASGFT